ncbi:MAG: hypothetical protein ACRD3W_24485 [Terriglobales bacterium]
MAAETWRTEKNAAEMCEVRDEYAQAAERYKHALTLVPSDDPNARTRIQASIAIDLLTVNQFNTATFYCDEVARAVKQMRRDHTLDPDTLLVATALQQTCERSRSPTRAGQHELNRIWLTLYDAIGIKNKDLVDQQLQYARDFVLMHDKRRAEKELGTIFAALKKQDPMYDVVQMCMAALQKDLGRPTLWNETVEKYHRAYPPANVAVRLAHAQLWVEDWVGARTSLDKALANLKGESADIVDQKFTVYKLYESSYKWSRDNVGAEKYSRLALELLALHKKGSQQYIDAREDLANVLKSLGRTKDAAAYEPDHGFKMKKEWEFMLNDQERADLAKQKSNENRSGAQRK